MGGKKKARQAASSKAERNIFLLMHTPSFIQSDYTKITRSTPAAAGITARKKLFEVRSSMFEVEKDQGKRQRAKGKSEEKEKFQITNPKFQINSKFQCPKRKLFQGSSICLGHLVIASWCLNFGAWDFVEF